MKNYILLFLTLFFVGQTWAQVRETTTSMSVGTYPALELELAIYDKKTIMDEWTRFIKDYKAKVRSDRKTDEVFADNAVIKAISGNNTIDIYALPSVGVNRAYLTVWFNLGGGYISSNSHAREYGEAQKLLMAFNARLNLVALETELKNEEEKLKNLEQESSNFGKENDKLQRENESMEKSILEMQKKIEQNKVTIQANQSSQTNKKNEVDSQKNKVAELQTKIKRM